MILDIVKKPEAIGFAVGDAVLIDRAMQSIEQKDGGECRGGQRPGVLAISGRQQFCKVTCLSFKERSQNLNSATASV
jgi:hypothetical protein